MRDEAVQVHDEEEAAFEAGFSGESEDTTEQGPQAEPEAEPQQPEEVAPTQKVLTEDDVKAAVAQAVMSMRGDLTKVHDRVFGKVGELQMKLDNLRASAMIAGKEQREKLKEEFPELAEMLFSRAEDSAPASATERNEPQRPTVDVESVVNRRIATTQMELERRLLTRDHRDWEQVAGSPEFDAWKDRLPRQDRERLETTWDADFISSKLTEFKQQRDSTVRAAAESREAKKRRVEAAITPRGVASGQSADEDDEEAAMTKAFGRR